MGRLGLAELLSGGGGVLMAERYFEGAWERDAAMRGFRYWPPGYYEEMARVEKAEKFISDSEARQLIPLLENSGLILPRLDERLRTEDLKITHRLLDLLEKR